MTEREYNKLKQQLQDDYDKKLQAIETVWLMSNSQAGNGTGKRVTKGELVRAVESVLENLPQQFTIADLERHLRDTNPALAEATQRSSMSGCLRRLAEDEKIVVREVGKGKRPTLYEKV